LENWAFVIFSSHFCFTEDALIMLNRITCLMKRFYLKYILRECISGVKRGLGFFGKIDFYIEQIGLGMDSIAVAIPRCFAPFTAIEIWIHEFVEHTIGNLLWDIFPHKRVRFGSMPSALPVKHFITCISTFSAAENNIHCWHITPDEYIEIVELANIRF